MFGSTNLVAEPARHVDFSARADELDRSFQQFSRDFFQALTDRGGYARYSHIDSLENAVSTLHQAGQTEQAVATILSNFSLVRQSPSSKAAISLHATLLDTNAWHSADTLYQLAQQESDRTVVSNMTFTLARHDFQRQRWRAVRERIAEIQRDLPAAQLQHGLLLQGIALQKLQNHRQAIDIYEKIPESSPLYPAARLNMALANLRQDWWTDAHNIFNELLADPARTPVEEQRDRLYTLLGYSFLHKQYYRNSREAFRHVSLDGPYTNRALLGIALTAAHQEDYIGALNASKLLSSSRRLDLPVDEAYLLTAYFYEKLGQYTTASAGYTDAINHYEQRIRKINNIHLQDMPVDPDAIKADDTVRIDDELIGLDTILPEAFFENYRRLLAYQSSVAGLAKPGVQAAHRTLLDNFRSVFHAAIRTRLEEKTGFLASYMNQARYGLARMYDNNTAQRDGS